LLAVAKMIRKLYYQDVEISEAFRKGGAEESAAFRFLYKKCLPQVSRFVLHNSGDEADASDVFQEGLMVLYKQVLQEKYRGDSTINTYLFSICRFIWFRKLKKEQRYVAFEAENFNDHFEDPEPAIIEDEKRQVVSDLFEQIGEQCKQILLYSIYQKLSMELIAEKMGFKDGQNARNKKFKCMKRLKQLVADNPAVLNLVQQVR